MLRFRFGLLVLALVALAGVPAPAQQATPAPRPDAAPLYVVLHVDFVPRRAAEGGAALGQFAVDTRKDDGNVRIEILQELAQPNHYIIQEVWRNRSMYDLHLGAPHTKTFRDTIQPLIGSPFDERLSRLST